MVAKNYTHTAGEDYHNTFTPVAKMVIIKVLLIISIVKRLDVHQLDINNSFLHGDLPEEVCMAISQGQSLYDRPILFAGYLSLSMGLNKPLDSSLKKLELFCWD